MTDEIRIGAQIMNAEYGDVDPEAFRVKHCENPDGRTDGVRIQYEDGSPAGVLAFMGMRLHAYGREYHASQACDAAVDPAFRGRSVLTKLFRYLESTDEQADLFIGFPNERSYPRCLHLGYRTVSSLYHYIYAIRPAGFLFGHNAFSRVIDSCWQLFLRHNRFQPLPGEVIAEYTDCPLQEDDLDAINASTVVGFQRSVPYYKWKTGYNRALEFRYLTSRTDGTLNAFLLCHVRKMYRGNALVIDDWYCPGDTAERERRLWTLLHATSLSYDLVHIPFVNSGCDDDAFFRGMHFMNACRKPFGRRVCPLIVSDHGTDASFMAQASIKNVDSDVLC